MNFFDKYELLKFINKYSLYHLIVLLLIGFFIILINNFQTHKDILSDLAKTNRVLLSKDIEYRIVEWFEERINNLESSVQYFPESALKGDEKALIKFTKTFLNQNLYFDTVQTLIPDFYFFSNENKKNDYRTNPSYIGPNIKVQPTKTPWYLNTMKNRKTTFTVMEIHGRLLKRSINICTPILTENISKGVLCGVLDADKIFSKLANIQLDQKLFLKGTYFFVANKKGRILSINNIKKMKNIESYFKTKNIGNQEQFILNNDVISIRQINNFDWYIGVGMDQNQIYKNSVKIVTEDTITIFIYFIIMMIITTISHEILQNKLKRKNSEYEFILAHRSRISEIGELISGINHQLYQPINSLSLMLSNTLSLSQYNNLDKETLEENLEMCQKSTDMLENTIKMFKNFYRCNDSITLFDINDAIQGVVHVLYIELSKNNISVKINNLENKKIIVNSIENFIQQILLVLIQNSKESILSKNSKKDRLIEIQYSLNGENIQIDVSDWGEGISSEHEKKLFNKIKSSKKKIGGGMGLYFSQKLAKEKLNGELFLVKKNNPTVFRLSIDQNLSKKATNES